MKSSTLLYLVMSLAFLNVARAHSAVSTELYTAILALDSAYFMAYNTCDMETQAKLLADDIEFYNDMGGLSTSKEEILKGISQNICGKVTRTIVEGSLEVSPIPTKPIFNFEVSPRLSNPLAVPNKKRILITSFGVYSHALSVVEGSIKKRTVNPHGPTYWEYKPS
mgnify:CR=1 FL=1